jgi:hypothetical protein
MNEAWLIGFGPSQAHGSLVWGPGSEGGCPRSQPPATPECGWLIAKFGSVVGFSVLSDVSHVKKLACRACALKRLR